MADYITLGLNIACGVLILFGIIWGLIRGVKKTSIRLLFLLLTTAILIFVTVPLTKLLLKIPVTATITSGGENITETMSILDLLTHYIKEFIGDDFVAKYPEFSSAIASLPILLLNAVLYIVLFWLAKYIFLPINYLLYRLLNIKRKPKEPTLGFADLDDEETPEYRSSDRTIDPLLEVYKESQKQSSSDEDVGMFIPKENNMDMNTPKGSAEVVPNQTTQYTPSKKEKQKLDKDALKLQKQQEKESKQSVKEKKSNKADKKAEKKLLKAEKPKKYRLWGGLVGVFVGVLVTFNTLIPIYGVMNILTKYNKTEIVNLTEDPISIDILTNGITGEIVKGYELSAVGRLSNYLGLSALGEKGFDQITSTKINDKKVILRKDIDSLGQTLIETDKLVGLYKTIQENGLENITQEQLDQLILGTENVISACEQTEFVDAMSDYILPIVYELLVTKDVKIVENDTVNTLILSTIKTVAEDAGIDIFDELKSILDIAKYLNSEKVLLHIVSNNYDNILDTIHGLSDDFEDNLSSKIFAIKTIDTTLPNILDIGLKMYDDMVNFGYVENTATKEELKSSFTQLLSNIVATARTLSADSSIYLTDNSLPKLGKTLDTLKSSHLFNPETYNNLVDYAINQIKLRTQDIVPATLTDVFNNQILRNVSAVESWETQMGIIVDALTILRDNEFGILGEVKEGKTLRVGYSAHFTLNEGTLINIGKALDKLETSTLLGTLHNITINDTPYTNATLTNVIASLLDEIYNTISTDESSDNTTKDIISIASTIKDNLIKSAHSTIDSTFWQDEMTAIAPLVIAINDLTSSEDITFDSTLGEALDTSAHQSVLLGGNTTLLLMEKLVSTIQTSVLGEDFTPAGDDSINDNIYGILDGMRTKLTSVDTAEALNNTPNFWQNEMICFESLMDIADEAESISTIADAQNIADKLDQVYLSNIIPSQQFNKTISTVLKQLKTDTTEGSVTAEINTLIEDIATDITNDAFWSDKVTNKEHFWKIELEHISSLDTIQLDGNNVLDNLPTIGSTLDSIAFGVADNIRPSYLITEMRIRDILSSTISSLKSSMAPSITNTTIKDAIEKATTDISNNIANEDITIVNFSTELAFLKSLSEIEIDASIFTQYTSTMTETESKAWEDNINSKLNSISNVLDSIGYNTTLSNNVTSYNDNANSNWITRSILSNIMSAVFSSAKITSDTLSTLETAFNTLITDLQASIISVANNNQVITWTRELSYVPFLIKLNTDAQINMDNITTYITNNIDNIAFNEKYILDNDTAKASNTFADPIYNGEYQLVNEYSTTYNISSTTYFYNSVLISRLMLKNLMTTVLEDIEITDDTSVEEKEIIDELISNCTNINTNYSATSNAELVDYKFNSFTHSLNELKNAKNTITSIGDNLNGKNISEINHEMMSNIDNDLTTLQGTLISGVITTRKIAILFLNHAETILTASSIPLATSAGGQYLTSLKSYYNSRISSTETEIYFNNPDDSGNTLDNPMATLYTLLTSY